MWEVSEDVRSQTPTFHYRYWGAKSKKYYFRQAASINDAIWETPPPTPRRCNCAPPAALSPCRASAVQPSSRCLSVIIRHAAAGRSSDDILLRFEHETRSRQPVRMKRPGPPGWNNPPSRARMPKKTHFMMCLDQFHRTSRQPGAQAGNVSPLLSPQTAAKLKQSWSAHRCLHKRTYSGAPTAQTSARSRLSFTLNEITDVWGGFPSPSVCLTHHSSPPNVTHSDLWLVSKPPSVTRYRPCLLPATATPRIRSDYSNVKKGYQRTQNLWCFREHYSPSLMANPPLKRLKFNQNVSWTFTAWPISISK